MIITAKDLRFQKVSFPVASTYCDEENTANLALSSDLPEAKGKDELQAKAQELNK